MKELNPLELSQAIHRYFNGEKAEMMAILAGSLVMLLLAVGLFLYFRDGFSRGFGITVLVGALLFSGTAATLLVRDSGHRDAILMQVSTGSASKVAEQESERISVVISKYANYRTTSLVIGLLALVVLAVTREEWATGMAVSLLVVVVSQTVIDYYSEARARSYRTMLMHHVPARQPKALP